MREQALCCLGLLHDRAAFDRMVALFPARRQDEIRAVLAVLSPLPDEELKNRWRALRESETEQLRSRLPDLVRTNFHNLPPMLQNWVLAYGCADH